ncbi:hypothetical protein [Marinilabilia salmonicolor]|uniref:hypothetical protein n=1 Tax=Marinilabilia salmonicolor TaxID=989 RepID=UPI00029A4918|nr:hypothetical protein [Marinilabilia salmonicolor]
MELISGEEDLLILEVLSSGDDGRKAPRAETRGRALLIIFCLSSGDDGRKAPRAETSDREAGETKGRKQKKPATKKLVAGFNTVI